MFMKNSLLEKAKTYYACKLSNPYLFSLYCLVDTNRLTSLKCRPNQLLKLKFLFVFFYFILQKISILFLDGYRVGIKSKIIVLLGNFWKPTGFPCLYQPHRQQPISGITCLRIQDSAFFFGYLVYISIFQNNILLLFQMRVH